MQKAGMLTGFFVFVPAGSGDRQALINAVVGEIPTRTNFPFYCVFV